MNDRLIFFSREKISLKWIQDNEIENGSWVIENIVASKDRRKVLSHRVIKFRLLNKNIHKLDQEIKRQIKETLM